MCFVSTFYLIVLVSFRLFGDVDGCYGMAETTSQATEVKELHSSNNLQLPNPRVILSVFLLPRIEALQLNRKEDWIRWEEASGICWHVKVGWPLTTLKTFYFHTGFPSSSSCTQQHHDPGLFWLYLGELELLYRDFLVLNLTTNPYQPTLVI